MVFKVDNGASVVATCIGAASPLICSASYATAALTTGGHTITVSLAADANYTANSNTGTLTVTAPLDFSLASTTSVSLSVVPGSTGTVSFNVAPLYQVYPGPVSFSVSGLPPGATYTITPSSIPANGGAQTVTVVITTPPALAKNIVPSRGAPIALALFVPLLAFGALRRRRWVGALLAGLFAASAVVGCGANTGNGLFGQAPQTYPVVITVTSGTMQHTINVNLQIL